jgi:hypothetical protein
MIKDQPLWLPRGSVRAILALVAVIPTMALFALNRDVPEALAAVVSVVLMAYFNDRRQTDAA